MQRLLVAVRIFFAVLFGQIPVESARGLLESGGSVAKSVPPPGRMESKGPPKGEPATGPPAARPAPSAKPAAPPPPARSDALTLLATLQREARFLDIVTESLGEYSDEQIGAAARDVLRGCNAALERMFGLEPVLGAAEGSRMEVAEGTDPGEVRVTGKVGGQPPYAGQVVHRGWKASRCELPAWSGKEQAKMIVAAAEVEVS